MARRAFTPAEDAVLRRAYRARGPHAVAEELERNAEQVYKRAKVLGLVRERERNWLPYEDEIIRCHYPAGGCDECARRLVDRSRSAVHFRAYKLGIGRSGERRAVYDYRRLAQALGMFVGVYGLTGMPSRVHRIIEDQRA